MCTARLTPECSLGAERSAERQKDTRAKCSAPVSHNVRLRCSTRKPQPTRCTSLWCVQGRTPTLYGNCHSPSWMPPVTSQHSSEGSLNSILPVRHFSPIAVTPKLTSSENWYSAQTFTFAPPLASFWISNLTCISSVATTPGRASVIHRVDEAYGMRVRSGTWGAAPSSLS